ncbi:MAG: DUF485 domain-containing protein [Vicinamibacterales bacterium]|jgi:uncharacterized membrane protein (DUF485 family)|nr:DUF485 domain-containing protein [Vicinamibacterales bacterium]
MTVMERAHHHITVEEWQRLEASPEFRRLLAEKRRFILPATIFFIVYYFALPVLVGYFPGLMERRVIGKINLAYLFALSQFFMAWAIMYLYVVRARRYDAMAAAIVDSVRRQVQ